MTLEKLIPLAVLLGVCATSPVAYAEEPEWGYGNQAWGALQDTDSQTPVPALYPFAECGLGAKQSPVDISSTFVEPNKAINPIKISYPGIKLSLTNNGHTIMGNILDVPTKDTLTVGREKYELLQYHFHAPSEHTISGQSAPLEIHFVHATSSGKLAVLAVLVKEGSKNGEFQKVLDYAPGSGDTNSFDDKSINLSRLLPASKKFYTYAGSLTTPPCTEGVEWFVLKKPIEVSGGQISDFGALYNHNNRSTQELNGRVLNILP